MNLYVDCQRRLAVEVDENPRYRRMLCSSGGVVDIVKIDPVEFAARRFTQSPEPYGALRFANTFSISSQPKTPRAAAIIEEIKVEQTKQLSMKEIVAEYNRITGKNVKEFHSRAEGLKALAKATEVKNTVTEKAPQETGGEQPTEKKRKPAVKSAMQDTAQQLTEDTMAKAKKTTKGKKAAKSKKANGSAAGRSTNDRALLIAKKDDTDTIGGLMVKLLKDGKDTDAILSAVAKKFNGAKTGPKDVSHYRFMLRKARELGAKGIPANL